MLLFKKKFLDAIRAGTKTQTIRLWKYRRMRNGQRSYIPGIGAIEILTVAQIEMSDLTEEDAVRDGFDTLKSLQDEISVIYSDAGEHDGKQLFRVLTEEETAAAKTD